MIRDIQTIDYDWLTKPTGDPFVDLGGYSLSTFSTYYPEANIVELIEKAANIYVRNWDKKIHSFFLNSSITQNAFKGREVEETMKYFTAIINNTGAMQGVCRVTGQIGYVFYAGRDKSILTGSSTYTNFHHCFQEGIVVSKEVLIRCFFVPLACEQLNGKMSFISCNESMVSQFFADEVCKRNLQDLSKGVSTSIPKCKSKSSSTALFRFADEVLRKLDLIQQEDVSCSLQLYMFTNFAASPELQIISLPFPILRFYRFVMKGQHVDSWRAFVSKYYRTKGARYCGNGAYGIKDGKEVVSVAEDEYSYWDNSIYAKLINGKSILDELREYTKENSFDFGIIKNYSIKILKMKKETIYKIEQIADFIIEASDERGAKKAISKLNGFDKAYELRQFILNDVVKKNFDSGKSEPIVTVKDYVDYLFPDEAFWQEIRDVLVIALYERMHQVYVATHSNDI